MQNKSGSPMDDKPQNLQGTCLNAVRKSKTAVTIYLVNGVKLQGNITWFDNFCVLLRMDGQMQLVYKHAISTLLTMWPVQLQDQDIGATEGACPPPVPAIRGPLTRRATDNIRGVPWFCMS